jgi:hypothetical protein
MQLRNIDDLSALSHEELQRLGCNFLQWDRVKAMSLQTLREKTAKAKDLKEVVETYLAAEDELNAKFGAVVDEILASVNPKKAN